MGTLFLTSPEDLSDHLKVDHNVEISPNRLRELAALGEMPYVKVDGDRVMFHSIRAREWVLKNVLQFHRPLFDGPKPDLFDSSWGQEPSTGLPDCLQRFSLRIEEFPLQALAMSARVYFLVCEGEVVYIGKTDCLGSRLITHLRMIKFDRVFFMPVHPAEALDVELALIRALKPKMNSQRPTQGKDRDLEAILARHEEV